MTGKSFARLLIVSLLLVVGAGAALAAPPAQGVTCVEDYSVQADDWLSKLADKFYGDVLAYPAIFEATNAVAQTDPSYTTIASPDLIEIGWKLCLPSVEDAQALLSGELVLNASNFVAPNRKMLLLIGNRASGILPATFTLRSTSGGQSSAAQQYTIRAGQEVQLEIDPGPYTAVWTAPASANGPDLSFGRQFEAIAGEAGLGYIVPEDSQIFAELISGPTRPIESGRMTTLGEVIVPETEASDFPYVVPTGKALLVAGNRSLLRTPATLTINGGNLPAGREYTIDSGQETLLALQPGDYSIAWSTVSGGNRVELQQSFTVSANRAAIIWVVPEESHAFLQLPGAKTVQF